MPRSLVSLAIVVPAISVAWNGKEKTVIAKEINQEKRVIKKYWHLVDG